MGCGPLQQQQQQRQPQQRQQRMAHQPPDAAPPNTPNTHTRAPTCHSDGKGSALRHCLRGMRLGCPWAPRVDRVQQIPETRVQAGGLTKACRQWKWQRGSRSCGGSSARQAELRRSVVCFVSHQPPTPPPPPLRRSPARCSGHNCSANTSIQPSPALPSQAPVVLHQAALQYSMGQEPSSSLRLHSATASWKHDRARTAVAGSTRGRGGVCVRLE